ncbi:MAG: FxDxF family PEP-CTERM protein [Thiobacillus sp.]
MKRTVTAVLALSCMAGLSAAHASQNFNLAIGQDFSTWTLLGDATTFNYNIPIVDSYLVLTHPGVGGEAGGAYAPTPYLIDFNAAFQFDFRFFVAHGTTTAVQGDGLTFFMTGGIPALGNGGSDLGYGGSGMSGYAVAVDTFNFGSEPQAVSVQVLGNGDVAPLAFTETGLPDIQPADYFQWFGTVVYTPSNNNDEMGSLDFSIFQGFTGNTYSVSFSGADFSGSEFDQYDIDSNYLGRGFYIGFTAGSGLADDGHFIGSLTPVPEPETWAMLLAGLGFVGWVARRRPG